MCQASLRTDQTNTNISSAEPTPGTHEQHHHQFQSNNKSHSFDAPTTRNHHHQSLRHCHSFNRRHLAYEFVRSLRSHCDVAGGGAPLAEALPLWHDTAVLRRADQLGRPGRELHGTDPVCGRCVHRLRCATHLYGHVLLAAHAAPLGGRSE